MRFDVLDGDGYGEVLTGDVDEGVGGCVKWLLGGGVGGDGVSDCRVLGGGFREYIESAKRRDFIGDELDIGARPRNDNPL